MWWLQIESLSLTFHGHDLIVDSELELNYGRFVIFFFGFFFGFFLCFLLVFYASLFHVDIFFNFSDDMVFLD